MVAMGVIYNPIEGPPWGRNSFTAQAQSRPSQHPCCRVIGGKIVPGGTATRFFFFFFFFFSRACCLELQAAVLYCSRLRLFPSVYGIYYDAHLPNDGLIIAFD